MAFSAFRRELYETIVSLAPAFGVILLFQVAVLRLPWSEFLPIIVGLVSTVFGFVLFIQGAKLGLLPLGEGIGTGFVQRRAVVMLLVFGFFLGVVLTVAEPDVRLLALQMEEAGVAPEGARLSYILVAALGLGVFGVLALLRIALDTSILWLLIPGYAAAIGLLVFADEAAATQAFDLGAVTTGPMTVPFLLALGVGVAAVLGGRDRLRTSFGVMAIGSIGPVLAILLWRAFGGGS
jgi:hypothetical protein